MLIKRGAVRFFSWLILLAILIGCQNQSPRQPNTPFDSRDNPPTAYYLQVLSTGIYEVCPQDLPAGSSADLRQYQVFRGGQQLSTWTIERSGSICLQFFVDFPPNRHAYDVRLRLVNMTGSTPILEVKSMPAGQPMGDGVYSPLATTEIEADLVYEPLYEDTLPWLWQRITPEHAWQEQIGIDGLESAPEAVTFSFWTKTPGKIMPNGGFGGHTVRIQSDAAGINQLVEWSGIGEYSIRITLHSTGDWPGEIDLKVEIPASAAPGWDDIYLDRLKFSYSSADIAGLDRLEAVQDGYLNTSGWKEGFLLVEHGGSVEHIYHIEPGSSTLRTFSDNVYRRFQEDQVQKPANISLPTYQQETFAALDGIVYLAIGPENLRPAFQPLLELRQRQGLPAAYLNAERFFEVFGDGSPDPAAVREGLGVIRDLHAPELQYVVMVGDTSHALPGSPDVRKGMPTAYVYTLQGGWTTSDSSLGDLDRDGLPDLSIGRLPVSEGDELVVLIDKIVEYEKNLPGKDDKFRIGIFADQSEPQFGITASEVANRITENAGQPATPYLVADRNILDWLTASDRPAINLVLYTGHGSIQRLGKEAVLSSTDMQENPGRSPDTLMVMFTCLAGYFAHPEVDSLAEALLKDPGSGFVAVYAPSSLTLSSDQEPLMQYAASRLTSGETTRMGDLFSSADFVGEHLTAGFYDVLSTMVLFGDPATSLPGH